MYRPIPTKFDIAVCVLTLNVFHTLQWDTVQMPNLVLIVHHIFKKKHITYLKLINMD